MLKPRGFALVTRWARPTGNPNGNKHESFFQILLTRRPCALFPLFNMNTEYTLGAAAFAMSLESDDFVRISLAAGVAEPNCFPPNGDSLLVDAIGLLPSRRISPIPAYISRRFCSPFPVAESRGGCFSVPAGTSSPNSPHSGECPNAVNRVRVSV